MFGSNFDANFGIPDFPYQGADPQGGYLGTNVPGPQQSQFAAPEGGQLNVGAPAATPDVAPQSSAIAAPNPLSAGPLAPGGASPQQHAPAPTGTVVEPPPAAGLGSPFGKPAV